MCNIQFQYSFIYHNCDFSPVYCIYPEKDYYILGLMDEMSNIVVNKLYSENPLVTFHEADIFSHCGGQEEDIYPFKNFLFQHIHLYILYTNTCTNICIQIYSLYKYKQQQERVLSFENTHNCTILYKTVRIKRGLFNK